MFDTGDEGSVVSYKSPEGKAKLSQTRGPLFGIVSHIYREIGSCEVKSEDIHSNDILYPIMVLS